MKVQNETTMDFKGTISDPDKENKYKYYKKLFLMTSYQLAHGFFLDQRS